MKIGNVFKILTFFVTAIALMCAMCITGSAASVNATEIELYGLKDWAKEFISIPEGSDSFQIKVSGGTNVYYYVADGDSVTVSGTGLIKTATRTIYWNGNVGYSSPTGAEGEVIETRPVFGKSVVRVVSGNESFDISVNVVDYNNVYADKIMDDYIAKNITSDMSEYEKLDKICQFVASYNYSGYYSAASSMIVSGGGDCWASTDAILTMCKKVGIDAWSRNGAKDPGAGSGHVNVMAVCDGKYYEADAGYVGTAPRYYFLAERTSLFSSRITDYDNKEIEIYQYDGKDDVTSLEIPSDINGYKVTSIADSTFSYLYELKTVKLPDTIEKIGAHAFSCNYSSLETLEIPRNVKEIGDNPFENCTLLNLTVSKDNPYFVMSDGVLYTADKKELVCATKTAEEFVVPDTVELIRRYAFRLNSNITYVSIPSTVTEIGEGAFGECSSLVSVTIEGKGLVTIGDFAFYYDSSLEKINIPDSVTALGKAAFGYCYALASITIPDSVTTFGDSVFYGDNKLIISCKKDSAVHQYAIDNSISYKLIIPAVSDFGVTARNDNSITLGWIENADADGYIIQQMKNNVWTNIANIKDNSVTSYKISGLVAGTGYKFRAVAYITYEGANYYSSYTKATEIYTAPVQIKSFAISGRGSDYLTISWAKNTGATGYIIQEQVNGVWKNIANIKNNATVTYKHTGLNPDSFHRYRMVAYKKDANGTCYSKYTSAFSGYTAPAMVSGFKVTNTGIRDITVSWSKVASADGYVVDIYKDGKWTEVARYKSNTTLTYKATGLTSGTQYKFRIKSYATNGTLTIYSTYSSSIAATTEAFKIENLRMTNRGNDFISVRWDKNENADGYMVYIYDGTSWKLVKTLTSNSAVSHKITELESGKAYKITVKAFMTCSGERVISDVATISAMTL